MAWNPDIQVLDARNFPSNILGFIRDNQTDALSWANGGSALPDIESFYKSPRLVNVFPSLTVLQHNYQNAIASEDTIQMDYAITLETAILHGLEDYLASNSPKYAMAIESMLANIPETTLNQTSIIEIASVIIKTETAFDLLDKRKSQFLQVFQTRATWRMEASLYS